MDDPVSIRPNPWTMNTPPMVSRTAPRDLGNILPIIVKMKPLVIALGGNAISPEGEADTIENQFLHTRATADRVATLVKDGWERIVITHGNGPQVGNVVRRVEHSRDIAPWLPLDICVADTQGGMGYMIQQCLSNALAKAGLSMPVATVVTQVVVDASDPAFDHPSKPIGPDHKLVPSPVPKRVVEADAIAGLMNAGILVVAGGGGGVPVVEGPDGLNGVEAVVDKDLTAGLIARAVGAGMLVILTDVDGVYSNFGTGQAEILRVISADNLRRLGRFEEGSMGPKVEAACGFVESGGDKAVIAALDDLIDAVAGRAGTTVIPG